MVDHNIIFFGRHHNRFVLLQYHYYLHLIILILILIVLFDDHYNKNNNIIMIPSCMVSSFTTTSRHHHNHRLLFDRVVVKRQQPQSQLTARNMITPTSSSLPFVTTLSLSSFSTSYSPFFNNMISSRNVKQIQQQRQRYQRYMKQRGQYNYYYLPFSSQLLYTATARYTKLSSSLESESIDTTNTKRSTATTKTTTTLSVAKISDISSSSTNIDNDDNSNNHDIDNDNEIKTRTLEWLQKIVIGFNLCPFADYPYRNDLLHIHIIHGNDIEGVIIPSIIQSLHEHINKLGTTLIICPDLYPNDFLSYYDIVQYLDDEIINDMYQDDLQGIVQIAPFHPLFTFNTNNDNNVDDDIDDDDENDDDDDINDDDEYDNDHNADDNNLNNNNNSIIINDPGDYTNRSPYPMFHIIREDDVTNAVYKIDGDANRIWVRNVDLLNEIHIQLGSYNFHQYMMMNNNINITNSNISANSNVSNSNISTNSSSVSSNDPRQQSCPHMMDNNNNNNNHQTNSNTQQEEQEQLSYDQIQAIVRSTIRDFRNKTYYNKV